MNKSVLTRAVLIFGMIQGQTSVIKPNNALHDPGRPVGLLGRVWKDLDADGQIDALEQGGFGVPVDVQYPLGTVVASTTTWFDGWFEFLTQDYPLLEQYPVVYLVPDLPPTWTITIPSAGYFTIAPSDWMQAFYIGVNYPEAMQGYCWHDDNGDGVWQNQQEVGWAGIDIQILEPVTGNLVGTTVTNNDGYYSFNVPPRDPGECTAPSQYETYDPCYLQTITDEPWCCYATWDYDCDILYSDCFFGYREQGDTILNTLDRDEFLTGRARNYAELEIHEVVPDNMQMTWPTEGNHVWTWDDWGSLQNFGNGNTSCGNGIIDSGEECDDNNLIEFDGCNAICELEGDLLNDGILNVTDIVILVSLIVEQQPYEQGADVNGDGLMDVADIVQIISWILS